MRFPAAAASALTLLSAWPRAAAAFSPAAGSGAGVRSGAGGTALRSSFGMPPPPPPPVDAPPRWGEDAGPAAASGPSYLDSLDQDGPYGPPPPAPEMGGVDPYGQPFPPNDAYGRDFGPERTYGNYPGMDYGPEVRGGVYPPGSGPEWANGPAPAGFGQAPPPPPAAPTAATTPAPAAPAQGWESTSARRVEFPEYSGAGFARTPVMDNAKRFEDRPLPISGPDWTDVRSSPTIADTGGAVSEAVLAAKRAAQAVREAADAARAVKDEQTRAQQQQQEAQQQQPYQGAADAAPPSAPSQDAEPAAAASAPSSAAAQAQSYVPPPPPTLNDKVGNAFSTSRGEGRGYRVPDVRPLDPGPGWAQPGRPSGVNEYSRRMAGPPSNVPQPRSNQYRSYDAPPAAPPAAQRSPPAPAQRPPNSARAPPPMSDPSPNRGGPRPVASGPDWANPRSPPSWSDATHSDAAGWDSRGGPPTTQVGAPVRPSRRTTFQGPPSLAGDANRPKRNPRNLGSGPEWAGTDNARPMDYTPSWSGERSRGRGDVAAVDRDGRRASPAGFPTSEYLRPSGDSEGGYRGN